MRDLTEKENSTLNRGMCPFCACKKFFDGPEGGGSANIECANDVCQARFCVHGGFFTAQLIKEPVWGKIIETARAKKKQEEEDMNINFDGDALLDFMSPPKDRTLWARLKRRISDIIESSLFLQSIKKSFMDLPYKI